MLFWGPTPIALRRLHVLWFRFRHTQVWVWAPCWLLKDFARDSRGHTEAWESVSPTQGATPKRGKERKKDERKNAVPAFGVCP